MRYEWEKNTKNLIAAIIFLCFCFNISLAQTKSSAVNTQKIEKLLAESVAAFQTGDFIRTKAILREVFSIAPRNQAANTLAGIVADKENDLAKAEKHFALAAKTAPNAPETRNNYGAILLRLGRKKEAAKEFTASLAASPKQLSALVNLAQIRIAEGDLATARELFGKAKTIAPDAEILRALVTISLELREKNRAAQEFKEYVAALKAESASSGTNDKIRDVSLAEALLAGDLPNEARQELESVLANENQNVNALILLSKIFVQQKNIAAAGRLLESAVAGGLDDAKIYLALAEVYEAGGYPENAIPAMRRAIEKEPKNDFYRSRYGLLLVNSKAPAAALVRVEEALKEFPDSASLWFALGIAQFDDNKISEAQKAFEKALSIDPKLIPALAYLGAVFVEQARYADAVKIYEQAIELNGKVALLHYLMGDTLLKMTSIDDRRIEAALKRAAELDTNLTSANITLGRLYVRQSRWTEAAVFLERAAKLEPDRAETFYQLGRVYARLKRTDESKTTLERFKQLNDTQKQQKEVDRRELVRRLANVRF
ncbi:MAG: tetratricopeptide repeat protein [Acidobacteriota bacterium]|nr:tetratricopeptide repeat protein [Acidobacteriota bacterium]